MITSPTELITPNSTPVTAPVVLKRRQLSASSSAGKFALAATAKARPTMNETFSPSPPMIAMRMAMAPIATAAIFATQTSSFSESLPLRTMFDQMSCATAPDAEITRPATTARMVAKATPATMARNSSPPRSSASSGRAKLPVVPAASSPPWPRIARAPKPERRGHHVEGADQHHRPHHRSARRLGVGHGEEAHEDVRQARRAEHQARGPATRCRAAWPGTARARDRPRPRPTAAGRRVNRSNGLPPISTSTQTVITTAADMSRNALMICTQLVASMPPSTM